MSRIEIGIAPGTAPDDDLWCVVVNDCIVWVCPTEADAEESARRLADAVQP